MNAGLSHFFRFVFLAASIAAACALAPASSHAQGARGAEAGDFDYYVLSLSWSPTYCDTHEGGERGGRDRYYDRDRGYGGYGGGYGGYGRYRFYDRGGDYDRYDDWRGYSRRRGDSDEQCHSARPYAFVLHGLWPQYERRGWPEMCESDRRPWVPEETIDRMMDIMPSKHLVIQEYKKHGVCSGLDPREYFNAARQAYGSVHIPEQFQDLSKTLSLSPEELRSAFLGANKQLSDDMIQVVCSRRLLREVRVCFSKDLTPRPCSQREQTRRLCNSDTVMMPPVRGGGVGARGGPTQERGPRQEREPTQERDRM
jgi:ribonuclease T2